MVLCLNISSLQLHLFVTHQYEILLVLLVELSAPSNYLFPDHSTVFHGYPCKYSRSSLIWRRIVSNLEVLQKGMQECLFIDYCGVS